MPRPDASRQRGSERSRNYLTPRQAQPVIYWSRCPRPRRETRRASRSDARMRWDWWPRAALAGGLDPGSPGDRFQVTVHVEAETFRCREPASAAADTSAETRAIDPPAPEPAAPAADAAAGQAPIEPAVSLHLAAAAHGGGPTAAAPGPDAGQAVIEPAGGIHVGKDAARRVACDAAGWWCCSTAPTATCSTWDAGPARSRPRCAVPSRAGITTSASSPAAVPATATPMLVVIGLWNTKSLNPE